MRRKLEAPPNSNPYVYVDNEGRKKTGSISFTWNCVIANIMSKFIKDPVNI